MKEFKCEMCGKVVKRGEMHSFDIFNHPFWREGDMNGDGVDSCEQICKKCSVKIQNLVKRTKNNAKYHGRL